MLYSTIFQFGQILGLKQPTFSYYKQPEFNISNTLPEAQL